MNRRSAGARPVLVWLVRVDGMQHWACCQRRRRVRALDSAPFGCAPGGATPMSAANAGGFPATRRSPSVRQSKRSAAATNQLHETGGGRLRIREGMVRPPVHDAQFAAEPLKPDRVLQVEELGRQPGGVDVVGVEARADGTTDQPSVKSIGAMLHEHRALCKAPKPFDHHRYRWRAVECGGVDAVDTASVRIDPIVAVHERLEAHQMVVHGESNCSQLNEVMRRLPRGLAIESYEVESFDRRVRRGPIGAPGIDGIVERGEGLGARRTEPR